MALVSSPSLPTSDRPNFWPSSFHRPSPAQSSALPGFLRIPLRRLRCPITASHLCTHDQTLPFTFDRSTLSVAEAFSDDQLWAAACLRVRSFYHFRPSSIGVEVSLCFYFYFSLSISLLYCLVFEKVIDLCSRMIPLLSLQRNVRYFNYCSHRE